MAESLFDRALLDRRRKRAFADPAKHEAHFLLRTTSQELVDRLTLVERHFDICLDLASHADHLADALKETGKADTIIRLERDAAFLANASLPVVADEEALPFADGSLSLIVSALSLHLTNDTPGVIVQARRALKADGLFLAAALGGETLSELRSCLLQAEAEILGGASPRVAPFMDVRDAGALLQRAGFSLPVADYDRLTVRYDSLFELMRDLRAMGMANVLQDRRRLPTPRRVFMRAAELYQKQFSDPDGRIRSTFDIIYLSGWVPHESQQKPARRGSATISLAEALKQTKP